MYVCVVDIWSILAFQLIALVGGVATGAAALLLGGAGSLRVLANRLELLEERQDHTDDRLTSEVKKRAAGVAVEKRSKAATVEEEARQLLIDDARSTKPFSDAPRAGKRPSVMGVVR